MVYDYLIVGCGLSGVVLAERIATILHKKVLIIDKRDHIGGNCYDYIDEITGIRVNKYGAHLFHTNDEDVWKYINQYGEWVRWEHKVLSYVDNKFVPIPVNITTINELCNQHLQNNIDVEEWLSTNQVQYNTITNSEEMAKSRIGEQLYQKMIKDYTFKQWNKYPHQLDKSILARIPVRPNFDTRYFTDKYQVLPKYGYTKFFDNLLQHPLIDYQLNTDFFQYIKENPINTSETKIIYTGPIDHYYSNCGLEKLEYRSIDFNIEHHLNCSYYQPNSVVNYPEKEYPYTRIVEYKHFLNQPSKHSIIISETTNDTGDPYYPVLNDKNKQLYQKYQKLATQEQNILFVGRLANFKYFNMDEAIKNSLDIFQNMIQSQ